jgi:hypothetical protein
MPGLLRRDICEGCSMALNNVHVLPFIAREDYDNFRVDIARANGLTIVLAEIIYDDFRNYCRANDCKPGQEMLLVYSRFKKAINKEYGPSDASVQR